MVKHGIRTFAFLCTLAALAACEEQPRDIALNFVVTANGQPTSDAQVEVDGNPGGTTDAQGRLSVIVQRKSGATTGVRVTKTLAGYRTEPWSQTFVVKQKKEPDADRYEFSADLKAHAVVTIVAVDGDSPVAGATVKIGEETIGETGDNGELRHELPAGPATDVPVVVSKNGYIIWKQTLTPQPGARLQAALERPLVLRVNAMTEEYGAPKPLKGIGVTLGDERLGTTDENGELRVVRTGIRDRKAPLTLLAPGFTPAKWSNEVALVGAVNIDRYFYQAKPRPVRLGVYRFSGNSAGDELGDAPARAQHSLAEHLFAVRGFQEVSSTKLEDRIKRAKLSTERLTTRGWSGTSLQKTVDVIVFGSVASDGDGGFLVETKFYSAAGKLILSSIASAKNAGQIERAAKEIAIHVRDEFPFEGHIVTAEGDRYVINLGNTVYPVDKADEFAVLDPMLGASGKVTGYKDIGAIRVQEAHKDRSIAVVDQIEPGAKLHAGLKVTRRARLETGQDRVRLVVKGKHGETTQTVAGVNIYINNRWMGATDKDGQAAVPVRLKKSYDLVLYRHGYEQTVATLKAGTKDDVKEFVMKSYSTLFNVDTRPSGANVYVDGELIGATPLSKPVAMGFHKVRLALGEDYRDWLEVIEFAGQEQNYTGDNTVTIFRDYLSAGMKAEQKGDIDGAIAAYDATEREHPDYAEARHRLALLYLDERKNYDAAIHEFENVVTMPEVAQMIQKQFAITYTNLGHAYYEKANKQLNNDNGEAARYFALAIRTLQTAKANSRFFPTSLYDQSIHDTYYYLALSYQKLYQLTKQGAMLQEAELAWRDYLDFFPANLATQDVYRQSREAAGQYLEQLRQEG